jgi:hypothetical protein
MSESPFWDAVHGQSEELIPAADVDAAEEAQIVEEQPSYLSAEEAVLTLPDHDLVDSSARKRRLLIYAGVPLLIVIALLLLNSGKKASLSSPRSAIPTQTTYSAVPYTPPPIKQTEQLARTPIQKLKLAEKYALAQYVGQTPTTAEMVTFLHKKTGLVVVGDQSGTPPENSIQVTSLIAGRFLLTWNGKPGDNSTTATRSIDLSQPSS